jgi:predicted membrane-bound dolichyl-phosphate-mannose-protein mannosyltransferase
MKKKIGKTDMVLVAIAALMFVGWLINGFADVCGSISENMKEVSRHEQYVATEASRAEVAALEFELHKQKMFLEYFKKQETGYSFYDFVVEEVENGIKAIQLQIKNLRGY